MSEITAADREREYVEKMGRQLGRVFYRLRNECQWMHLKWGEFLELFGTRPSRIELLNRTAPEFFRIAQDAIWNDTLLHISKLTDERKTGHRETLSIKQLPALVDDVLKPDVERAVQKAEAAAKFARDWRNKAIAHHDLQLALDEQITPLATATREKTTSAITAVADVLDLVEKHYTGVSTVYRLIAGRHGALTLLYHLRDSLDAEAALQERLRDRTFTLDDVARKPPI